MGLLKQNEKEANLLVAKMMRITFLFFSLSYVLDIIGIFTVDKTIMTIAYLGGSIMLLLPTLLVNLLKREERGVKYINVVCAAVFVMLLSITLTYHVVAIYVYPIAIASLYFSKKLNIAATALTVAGVSVGQVAAFYLKTLQDDNFMDMKHVLVFGVIPRALIVIALAAIFTTLCSRTATMLSSLLGAEEQKEMYNRMRKMQEQALQTSEVMSEMVSELYGITEVSLRANQSIVGEAERLLNGTTENAEAVGNADSRMQDIAEQLGGLSNMNQRTAQLTDRIGENTRENQKRMEDATASMEQINSSSDECKQIIAELGEQSKQIIGIVEAITGISNRTNILALNASIEAARAGEQGKGFAVVAGEIQKLSEQTKAAVENIGVIVNKLVRNTEGAVDAMSQNTLNTQRGMESIQKANESAALITTSNEELAEQIYEINRAAEIIREKSDEISERMEQISNNTQEHCSAVERVTAASLENSSSTESLAEMVEKIKELSGQLNKVVKT